MGVACALGCAAVQHTESRNLEDAPSRVRFEALADGSRSMYGSSVLARTELPSGVHAIVLVRISEDDIVRYGEVFEADASLAVPSGSSAAYCWRQGAVATARASDISLVERHDLLGTLVGLRNRVIDALADLDAGDGSAVLAALVCGWRIPLEEGEVYEAFKVTGLAHLVAVSGAHLSIVSAFIAGALRLMRVPRVPAMAVQAMLLLSYLVLAAAPPSAVRAAVMAFAGMLSFAVRRRPASLGALSACMLGFVALEPTAALSVSFALSALSTLGIVVFSGLCSSWIADLVPVLPRIVREALALTAASSITAAPFSASLFSMLPLVAPLANVVAAPLFPLVCAGGLVAAMGSLIAPAASAPLLGVASTGAAVLTGIVHFLANLPHASAPVELPLLFALGATAVLVAVLWTAWPRPRPAVAGAVFGTTLCIVVFAIALVPCMAGDEIIMLDVGQGDAFVVRSNGAHVLVDTGNQEGLLREALARHGVLSLDAVVVTHGDDDHMGALASLNGVVEVGCVLLADDALSCPCNACARLRKAACDLVGDGGVKGLGVGDHVVVGAFDLSVVWPEEFTDEGGNADSLCLLAEADADGDGSGDWTALFVGDAERDQLAQLVESGRVGKVDLYKVGHHGSKNALDNRLADALSPSIALVSAGEGNRYGHPAPETVALLEDTGALVMRTDISGDVSCRIEADRIAVETLR